MPFEFNEGNIVGVYQADEQKEKGDCTKEVFHGRKCL
jgi:hypothetical protein